MIYRAIRGTDGKVRLFRGGTEILPEASQKVRNHSPTGFEFGYAGSGPSQTALAILLDVVGEQKALALYQNFKMAFIAQAQESFEIEEESIKAWIRLFETASN